MDSGFKGVTGQPGTFVDIAFNEAKGSKFSMSSVAGSYTDEQICSFLSAIKSSPHRLAGKRFGIVCVQQNIADQIKKQLDKTEFQVLKDVIELFSLTAISEAEIEKWMTQVAHFLDKDNVIFGLEVQAAPNKKVEENISPSVLGRVINSNALSTEEKYIQEKIHLLRRRYHNKQQIFSGVDSLTPAIVPAQSNSSTAKVLAGTGQQSTALSAVAPTATQSKAINFVEALAKIKKTMQIGDVVYELKFDEAAIAAKSSNMKVEMFKKGQAEVQGSFTVSKDKITAHKMTVEVAFAMMKAYMEANPGQAMEIKPKDKAAHEFFVEAAKKLKDELDKISYTINAVDGVDKVDVRLGKVATSKVGVPVPETPVASSSLVPTTPIASDPSTSIPVASSPVTTITSAAPSSPMPVQPVISEPSLKSQAQSLPDGNCLFNAFALGLLEITRGGLPVSSKIKEFIEENKNVFELTNSDAFQQKIASVLRKKAVALARAHSDINKTELQEPLFVAFEEYSIKGEANFDDDIFLQHQFIKDKFREKDLSKDVLTAWWQSEGYDLFLTEMEKNAKWAGDLELAELANHFEVNINIVGSNEAPVSHLYAAKLSMVNVKLSEVEKNELMGLGVTRVSFEANDIPIALTASQLQDRVRAMRIIMGGIKKKDISSFDDELIILGIYSKKTDGEIVRKDAKSTAELFDIYQKIFPQLNKFNEGMDKYPAISLKHSGNHWDVMGVPDRGVAASPINKAR